MSNNDDTEGRAERLKEAFPGAYTEQGDGIVAFDMEQVSKTLGLFHDWIINFSGDREHPMDGGPHFRIGCSWGEPTVYVELPVQVNNTISSWTFRIKDWQRVAEVVEQGLLAVEAHIEQGGR